MSDSDSDEEEEVIPPKPPSQFVTKELAERLADALTESTSKATSDPHFAAHISTIESGVIGGNTPEILFPNNPYVQLTQPPQGQDPNVFLSSVPPPPPNPNDMKVWTSAVTHALNSQNTEIAALHKLLVHSISQNNMLSTFSTSVIQ